MAPDDKNDTGFFGGNRACIRKKLEFPITGIIISDSAIAHPNTACRFMRMQ